MAVRSCNGGQSSISQKTFNLHKSQPTYIHLGEERVKVSDARNDAGNKDQEQSEI